ncbi:hypothetical protein C6Y45_03860 [Alkalicoccus saliphilus]|jgi:hypothetical protein|uniref:Uncharacterized protein n=1 Tax=Alkalicoccus saliphilus TaxID=200989 RepID=A0A2T4U8S2_9BACI|nr:hypothetical protein C6Y45_03860 [Alkalicoccus saliphilus]
MIPVYASYFLLKSRKAERSSEIYRIFTIFTSFSLYETTACRLEYIKRRDVFCTSAIQSTKKRPYSLWKLMMNREKQEPLYFSAETLILFDHYYRFALSALVCREDIVGDKQEGVVF